LLLRVVDAALAGMAVVDAALVDCVQP